MGRAPQTEFRCPAEGPAQLFIEKWLLLHLGKPPEARDTPYKGSEVTTPHAHEGQRIVPVPTSQARSSGPQGAELGPRRLCLGIGE